MNILASRLARGPDPREFIFWFSLIECLLCAPVGLVLLGTTHVSTADILWLMLTGVCAAAAGSLLTAALRHGQLGVVGPLLALEGAVAALLGIAYAGGMPSVALDGGLGVSVLGGMTVAFGATRRGHLAGSRYALAAAFCAGIALWAFTRQPLAPLLALMITRIFGSLTMLPTVSRWRLPSGLRWLLAVAVLDITANVLFLVGVRGGSLSTTAVLAAQFGTFTALGGIWHWKESLTGLQVAGLIILAAGVAVVAAS
jgi:drug/metabolite transporter (DMT)-like permease